MTSETKTSSIQAKKGKKKSSSGVESNWKLYRAQHKAVKQRQKIAPVVKPAQASKIKAKMILKAILGQILMSFPNVLAQYLGVLGCSFTKPFIV